MMKRTIAGAALLPVLLVLAACRGERAQQEQAPAAEQQVGQVTYEILVTNPMPHAMTVFADYGMGETELGVVPPNQTITFNITSPGSTTVKLRARDEGASHEVTGNVSLGEGIAASWTIGG